MKKKLQNLYLLLIVIFLYAPIMTLMVLSFNSSRTRAKWGGFTGKWYVSLFQDEAIMSTLYNTLIIALLSALIATVIGTLASIGIQSMNRKFRTFMLGVTNIPMLNADIVRKPSRARHTMRLVVTRVVPALLVIVITAGGFFYNSKTKISGAEKVIVYNWGEYLDPDVLDIFEEETGIQVVYEEYETNEIMYPKVQSGAISYDVVCPSDYMIQRMIENDLLAEINWDNIPNIKNIGQTYMDQSKAFDPENKYSVPYCWGTVGILYNKTMVDEPIDSWSVLWDPKYKDSILMQDSVRDAFGVTLKYLGYSLNSTDLDELNEAKNLLIKQKPLVQAYVVDQVRDKMIGNEAAIGVIYSGEAIYTQKENPNLEYVIPKEGSNIWIDSWVIPKNAEHKENAEKFINFLCRPDIALKNFEYITYSTPNEAARELIEDESIRNSKIAFPDASELSGCETFKFLGDKNDAVYNELWREVKSK